MISIGLATAPEFAPCEGPSPGQWIVALATFQEAKQKAPAVAGALMQKPTDQVGLTRCSERCASSGLP